jgi:hypothetical protein
VLDGDIGVENDSTDNTYHVVYCGNGDSVSIDGFYITNGNAFADIPIYSNSDGGAIFIDSGGTVFLESCIFANNNAWSTGGALGAVYCEVSLKDCDFEANFSHNSGGAVGAIASKVIITECRFRNNFAKSGSCIDDKKSRIVYTRCSFISNGSVNAGAIDISGAYSYNGHSQKNSSLYSNSLFRDNYSRYGADIRTGQMSDTIVNNTFINASDTLYSISESGSFPIIKNCLFTHYRNGGIRISVSDLGWGKPEIGNCLFADSTALADSNIVDLGGNIFATPVFPHAENGDYSLTSKSPGVNGGDNNAIRNNMEKDFAGNPRIAGSAVDIGAYEYQE